jgi:hypothetical protein
LSDLEAVQAMMTRYLAALQANDFDGAMNERCTGIRIPAGDEELFMPQAATLLKMGRMTAVEVADRSELRILPNDASAHPIDFEYAMQSADGRSEWLHGVAIEQDGKLRLCGYAQPEIARMTSELGVAVAAGDNVSLSPEEFMPENGPTGYTQIENDSVSKTENSAAGWQSAWTRAWQLPVYGGARVTATRFASSDSASQALTAALKRVVGDATETFTLQDVPNTIGVRYSAVAWTLLQPPDVGYQIDRVVMLYGNTYVMIEASGLTPDQSHEIVIELANAINAMAVSAPES